MVTFITINIYSPPELNCILNKFSFPSIFEKRDMARNHSRVMISRFELTPFTLKITTDIETGKQNE